MNRSILPTATVLVLLAAAACSSSPDAPQPATEGPSALFQLLGGGTAGSDYAAQERQIQDLTASCMKTQGFEYVPDPGTFLFEDNEDAEALTGSRAFAEKYGYGISRRAPSFVMQAERVDPNADRVAAMSASEQDAYWAALNGDGTSRPNSADGTAAPTPPTVADAGCQGVAQFEVRGTQTGGPANQELWDEYLRRLQAVENEPRMVEKVRAWTDCMADKGYPDLTGLDSGPLDLANQWNELYGATVAEDGESFSTDLPNGPIMPSAEDIAAFKEREIAMAVTDFDCRSGLDTLRAELTAEMEAAFTTEFQAELERLRDGMTGD